MQSEVKVLLEPRLDSEESPFEINRRAIGHERRKRSALLIVHVFGRGVVGTPDGCRFHIGVPHLVRELCTSGCVEKVFVDVETETREKGGAYDGGINTVPAVAM